MKLILLTLPLMLSIIVFCDINTDHNCEDLGCNYNAEEDISKLIDCKPDGRRVSIMFHGNGCNDWNEYSHTESSLGHQCCSQETSTIANAALIPMPMPNPQIVGGTATEWTTYPFIVLMDGCSGSVLRKSSPAVILTAAHCFRDFEHNSITIGADVYNYDENDEDVVTKQIHSWVIHPDYNPYTDDNDIAILWINSEIESSNPFYPIKEVVTDPWPKEHFPIENKEVLELIGYGEDASSSGTRTNTIEVAEVNYITETECDKHWPSYELSTKICTLTPGKTHCGGDSGGPLMKKGSLTQVGVVSFGTASCNPAIPAVYTDVSDYTLWINSYKLLQSPPPKISAEVYAYCHNSLFDVSYDGGATFKHFEDRLGPSNQYKAIGFPIPVVTDKTVLRFDCSSNGNDKGFIATIIDYKNKNEINTDAFTIPWDFGIEGNKYSKNLTYTTQTEYTSKNKNFEASRIQSSAQFVWQTKKDEMTFYYYF